jgi:Domain of unknown function (DUF4440)
MQRWKAPLLATALAGGLLTVSAPAVDAVKSPTVAATVAVTSHPDRCAQRMIDAVNEDNDAYNSRDIDRYEAILHPDMIYERDGAVIFGREAVLDGARAAFEIPGWTWTWEILDYRLYGACRTGIVIIEAHTIYPDLDKEWAVTMTMVREGGKWLVAMDTVHLVSETPIG